MGRIERGKIRILMIETGGWGGICHYTYNLANALVNAGIKNVKVINGERYEIDSECPVIGTIGRLIEQKGHRYFLEAAAKVKKEINNVIFLIVGEGPLRKEGEGL